MGEVTDANDLFYEQMIEVLRPQIAEEMIPSHVLFHLPDLRDVAADIMKVEKRSRKDAVELLIDALLEKRCPGWYTQFVDALQAADFEKLAKRLSCKDVKNDEFFKSLISHCLPDLLQIQLLPILGHLLQDKVISDTDMDEVMKLESESHHLAVYDLVLRLPMRRENWIERFVVALKRNNERTALTAIEPLLDSAQSDESLRQILTDLRKGNTEEFESDPEKLKKLSEDDVSRDAVADGKESPADEIEETFEFHESKEPSLEVNAPNINMLSAYQQDKDNKKGEKLVGIAKPMMSGAQKESEMFINPLHSSNSRSAPNETHAKDVFTDIGRGGETQVKQCEGGAPGVNQAIRETTPKTLGREDDRNVGRWTSDYPPRECDSNEADLNLRSEDFPSNTQPRVNVGSRCPPNISCSDNNFQELMADTATCSQSNTTSDNQDSVSRTLGPDESQLSGSVETRVVVVPYKIFVSNLPTFVTKEDIVDHFGMIGDIKLTSKGVPIVHIYRDKATGVPKGEALIPYANETYANAAVDIFHGTEFEGNILNVEIAWRKVKSSSSVRQSVTSEKENESSLDGSTLVPVAAEEIHEELKLRGYQEELAAKAKAGDNCIIVAPTGSGKTHVAMEIVRHHIEKFSKRRNPNTKTIFFVPTVALVEQQRKQFEKYLRGRKILGLSGDQDAKLPLSELVPINDIMVMTPQILENALKEEDFNTLSIFSLMIFDECHHTSKNHPYNMIMAHYIDEKLDRSRRSSQMPQVVGLTASVGVGKSKSMDQAVTCILRLCANMDAVEICTVREHERELANHVNRPIEDTTELSGRKEDPFFSTISKIMGEIEGRMKTSQFATAALDENAEFGKLLQAPAERGGDRYTQWMSRLQKPVDAIYLQNTRRFYVSCIRDLQIYNTALLINADCRTKDALDYIVKEFNPAKVTDLNSYQDETDFWLKGLFEAKKTSLETMSKDPKYENPKLNHLKNIICEEYRKAPDSRGIIFCKTREMTVALVNWMNDTPELKLLNPHNLVGSNAPSNKAGMTQVKQEDVLTYFKLGSHRLIVATSVAEEGLDVQKCNIVIRYEHVTNQIARVQSRGRARAGLAQYLVVAEKGRGAAEKEECNKIREKMMKKAIDIINDYETDEKLQRISRYQKEAQVEREMAKKGKEISKLLKASQNTDGRYTLRCLKCDSFTAYSTDIRKIEASHHVLLDKDYGKRIVIRPHPAPKKFENFELTGKIYCKKCHADWGIMGVYKKVSFPVVKVCSFIVINDDEQRRVYKRWKEVPFTVRTLSPEDLQEMMIQHMTNSEPTIGDDVGDFLNGDVGEFDAMDDISGEFDPIDDVSGEFDSMYD